MSSSGFNSGALTGSSRLRGFFNDYIPFLLLLLLLGILLTKTPPYKSIVRGFLDRLFNNSVALASIFLSFFSFFFHRQTIYLSSSSTSLKSRKKFRIRSLSFYHSSFLSLRSPNPSSRLRFGRFLFRRWMLRLTYTSGLIFGIIDIGDIPY